MALVLEASARKEVISRRRHTLDRRVADCLCALLWVADGRTQQEAADLLGVTARQVRKWLHLFLERARRMTARRCKASCSWLGGLASL